MKYYAPKKRSGFKENGEQKFGRYGKKQKEEKKVFRKKQNAPKSINYLRYKILIEIMKEDKEMKIKT